MSYERLEKNGINSFIFYNQWGIIENENGDYQTAYKKYEQALRFEGDQAWVLLNWGWAALTNGELQLAREKYLQSLNLGTIPNAVQGLLVTLWHQGDKKAFVENFERYSGSLGHTKYPERSDLERGAIIFSCELGLKLTKTLLSPDEGIFLEGKTIPRSQFQKMFCASGTVH